MKKIMFNDKYCLTQAVLEGRKTMTRRIAIYPPELEGVKTVDYHITRSPYGRIIDAAMHDTTKRSLESYPIFPQYRIGEVIAIAQPYRDVLDYLPKGYRRKSDGWISDFISTSVGLNNKMFVRADLMPHHIRITNVKIERLQDISDEDCLKEGVEFNTRQYECDGTLYYYVRGLGHWRAIGCTNFDTPRDAFSALIDKVSGKGTWESNPIVWTYKFELID